MRQSNLVYEKNGRLELYVDSPLVSVFQIAKCPPVHMMITCQFTHDVNCREHSVVVTSTHKLPLASQCFCLCSFDAKSSDPIGQFSGGTVVSQAAGMANFIISSTEELLQVRDASYCVCVDTHSVVSTVVNTK